MSKIIASAAIRGAHKLVERAEADLAKAIEAKGKDQKVEYPDTAYFLPIMLMLLGQKVEKLGDLEESLQEARKLLPEVPSDELWLPYLGGTLNAGAATLIAEETIEALKCLMGPNPVEGIWLGFTNFAEKRKMPSPCTVKLSNRSRGRCNKIRNPGGRDISLPPITTNWRALHSIYWTTIPKPKSGLEKKSRYGSR